MRAVIQRVKSASVTVDKKNVGAISKGCVILLGIKRGDTVRDAEYLAEKCANMRIFDDEEGKLNLSALDVNAELLVVSQFTLYGDCRKGRRPSFTEAAPHYLSHKLYNDFTKFLRAKELTVAEGVFGAKMLVEINNDGPVTIIIDSPSDVAKKVDK